MLEISQNEEGQNLISENNDFLDVSSVVEENTLDAESVENMSVQSSKNSPSDSVGILQNEEGQNLISENNDFSDASSVVEENTLDAESVENMSVQSSKNSPSDSVGILQNEEGQNLISENNDFLDVSSVVEENTLDAESVENMSVQSSKNSPSDSVGILQNEEGQNLISENNDFLDVSSVVEENTLDAESVENMSVQSSKNSPSDSVGILQNEEGQNLISENNDFSDASSVVEENTSDAESIGKMSVQPSKNSLSDSSESVQNNSKDEDGKTEENSNPSVTQSMLRRYLNTRLLSCSSNSINIRFGRMCSCCIRTTISNWIFSDSSYRNNRSNYITYY